MNAKFCHTKFFCIPSLLMACSLINVCQLYKQTNTEEPRGVSTGKHRRSHFTSHRSWEGMSWVCTSGGPWQGKPRTGPLAPFHLSCMILVPVSGSQYLLNSCSGVQQELFSKKTPRPPKVNKQPGLEVDSRHTSRLQQQGLGKRGLQ